jgi:hypothetical protein
MAHGRSRVMASGAARLELHLDRLEVGSVRVDAVGLECGDSLLGVVVRVRQASGAFVMTVAPSAFFVSIATCTVWSQAASSTMPIPFSDGQISLLISFICQSWWLAPSLEPLATTMSRHFSALSRQ